MEQIDYIVVGAGIAGLGAAYSLHKQGKKVLILEKNSDVGGRMSTKQLGSVPIDIGAKFITQSYRNIWQYARELNIEPIKVNIGKVAVQKDKKNHVFNSENPLNFLTYKGLSLPAKLRLLLALTPRFLQAKNFDVYDLRKSLPLDKKSVFDDLKPFLKDEEFDYFLNPMCEALFFYGSKEFSKALFFIILSKFIPLTLYSFKNGINLLCKKLAENLDVQTNTQILSIKRLKNTVEVRTENKTYHANKVIMAIPGNKVLSILKTPTTTEADFFSKIQYSSAGYIYCKAKTNLFDNCSTIWLPYKENKYFSSMGKNPYQSQKEDSVIFSIGVRSDISRDLFQSPDYKKIKRLVRDQLEFDNSLEILHTHYWESALPKFTPGYITRLYEFLDTTKDEKQIFYCGDYMENPSTEGALTSGITVGKRLC